MPIGRTASPACKDSTSNSATAIRTTTRRASDDTWKVGLNYRPIEQLLFRVMQQKATRAPNVGELASPPTAGLDNATRRPVLGRQRRKHRCGARGAVHFDGHVAPPRSASCEDIAVGQINVFFGTDLNNLPDPEDADTFTVRRRLDAKPRRSLARTQPSRSTTTTSRSTTGSVSSPRRKSSTRCYVLGTRGGLREGPARRRHAHAAG